jgi:Na+/melibiose symporter-like transporter
VPTSKDPEARKLDPVGTVLSILGLTGILYAIIEAPTEGLTNPTVLTCLIAGLVGACLFALWEPHSDHPMLDVHFFQNPRFSAASVSITLAFFAMTGLLFFLTQYLQPVLGYTPLRAGLALIPVAVTMMISSLSSARLDARFGSKATVVTGMTIAAGGVALLMVARVNSPYALVAAILAILGLGLVMTPATNSIMGSLPLGKAGVGSAINDTTRQIGGALGVAVLGSITNAVYRSSVQATAAVQALPAAARSVVRAGIGNVVLVAHALPPAARGAVVAGADHAFVHINLTAVISTVLMLAAAGCALAWLPARPAEEISPEELMELVAVLDPVAAQAAEPRFPEQP